MEKGSDNGAAKGEKNYVKARAEATSQDAIQASTVDIKIFKNLSKRVGGKQATISTFEPYWKIFLSKN